MRFCCIQASIATLVFLNAPSTLGQIVSVSTATGRGADTHVLRHYPTINYGAQSVVRVKHAALHPSGAPFDRKAYLRFDLSGVDTTALDSVQLSLVVGDYGTGIEVGGLQQFRVYGLDDVSLGELSDADPGSTGWQEGTGTDQIQVSDGIVWLDAPANDTNSGVGMLSAASLLATFELDGTSEGGVLVVVGSETMTEFIARDTNGLVTLVISRTTFDPEPSGWVHNFASREHPLLSPPTLVIDLSSADVNNDGCVDLTDLAIVLADFGCSVGCSADADGDGDADLSDLAEVLANFGQGC